MDKYIQKANSEILKPINNYELIAVVMRKPVPEEYGINFDLNIKMEPKSEVPSPPKAHDSEECIYSFVMRPDPQDIAPLKRYFVY